MAQSAETILFSIPLVRPDELREAARATGDPEEFDRAYLPLGVSRVTSWLQRHPDYLTVLWEGRNLLEAVKETAVSTDPHFAKWRGFTRIYAGPDSAQAFWDGSRDRVFLWSSGEVGADSEARVFHGTSSVGEYLRFVQDIQNDPKLWETFDLLRRQQGFTRAELWHQTAGPRDVVISLWEAHDMEASIDAVVEGGAELDQRILAIRRAALVEDPLNEGRPEILMDWRAQ